MRPGRRILKRLQFFSILMVISLVLGSWLLAPAPVVTAQEPKVGSRDLLATDSTAHALREEISDLCRNSEESATSESDWSGRVAHWTGFSDAKDEEWTVCERVKYPISGAEDIDWKMFFLADGSGRQLVKFARGEHATAPINVALAWVTQQKNITTAVVGSRKADQVKEFCAAGEITLTSDQLDRLNQASAEFHYAGGIVV